LVSKTTASGPTERRLRRPRRPIPGDGTLAFAGRSPEGRDVYMNREYVEADRRIVLGFIEPHFMAGFSSGYKGVFPAVADITARISKELRHIGQDAPVAVLPEGPMTVPYL